MSELRRALVAAVCTVIVSGPAWGGFQVNTYTVGDQRSSSVAVDGSGNFMVAWVSTEQDGDSWGIFAQRYDSTGTPLGSEFPVNPDPAGQQLDPAVAAADDGSVVVGWSANDGDGDSSGIFAQRYDSLGIPAGTTFQVNTHTTSSQSHPVIAADAAGNFVVGWTSHGQDGDSTGVFAQRFGSNGVAIGQEFQVNTYTTAAQGPNHAVAIASAPDGRFVVAWRSRGQDDGDTSVSGGGVFAQRFEADGTPAGSEFQVNTYTPGQQGLALLDVAMDAAGDFVVVWNGDEPDSHLLPGGDVFGQRFSSTGGFLGTEFLVATSGKGSKLVPVVGMDAGGNFLVAFEGKDRDDWGVLGRSFASDGTAVGNDFRINIETLGAQSVDSAASNPAGHFVVTWTSDCNTRRHRCEKGQDGDGAGVFARRFNTAPAVCAATPKVGCFDAGRSSLALKQGGTNKLRWKWLDGPAATVDNFGNPANGLTSYALCMYKEDGGAPALVLGASVPAGGQCGGRPCWKSSGHSRGFRYRDSNVNDGTADGIVRIRLKAGAAGRTMVAVKGKGPDLALPLPIGSFTKITTQLVNGNGECWQSEHDPPAGVNTDKRFKDKF